MTPLLSWVIYGVVCSAVAIAVMCTVTASLNGTSLVAISRARRRRPA